MIGVERYSSTVERSKMEDSRGRSAHNGGVQANIIRRVGEGNRLDACMNFTDRPAGRASARPSRTVSVAVAGDRQPVTRRVLPWCHRCNQQHAWCLVEEVNVGVEVSRASWQAKAAGTKRAHVCM